MPAYSYIDMIDAKIEELSSTIEKVQWVNRTLDLSRPLTLAQTNLYARNYSVRSQARADLNSARTLRRNLVELMS